MKIQIRRGVFETNSSSTHSLQLVHKNLEDMIHIIDNYDKLTNNVYRTPEFMQTEKWINDGVLRITHMNLIYSDYSKSYYYIFDTLISKIMFIGMLYFGISRKYFKSSDMEIADIVEKMESLPLFERINKEIIKAVKKYGYDISSINWNIKRVITTSEYFYNEKWNNIFIKSTFDEEKFLTIIKRILKPGYSVSFSDIAYFSAKKITYIL